MARVGETGRFQGFCPTLAGTPKWWDVVVTPMKGPDGRPERLLWVSRDITERKQAEDRIAETAERYRLAARATNDAIWDWDLATDHILWNEAVQTLFGYASEDVGPLVEGAHPSGGPRACRARDPCGHRRAGIELVG